MLQFLVSLVVLNMKTDMTGIEKEHEVRWLLRMEGLCVLIAACVAYSMAGVGWGTFTLYFLVPDIAIAGYLINVRVGAIAYNTTHSYVGAFMALASGYYVSSNVLVWGSTIWFAHIGFDRAMGYGLKYSTGFADTHLGMIRQWKKLP